MMEIGSTRTTETGSRQHGTPIIRSQRRIQLTGPTTEMAKIMLIGMMRPHIYLVPQMQIGMQMSGAPCQS